MSAEGGESPPSPMSKGRGRSMLAIGAVFAVVAVLVVAAFVILEGTGDDGNEDVVVPGPPSDLALMVVTGDYLVLTWQSPSDQGGAATAYILYCCGVGPNNISTSWMMDPIWNSKAIQSSEIFRGWTYDFYIVAVNGAGESERSNTVTFSAFFAPNDVQGSYEWGDGYVNMTWSPPSDDGGKPLTGYIVRRSIWNDYSSLPTNFTFDLGTCRFNDTSAVNGVTYEYSVSALNEVGIGDAYGMRVIPGAPGMVTRILTVAGDHYINVIWLAPENEGGSPITKYEVSRLQQDAWELPYIFEVPGSAESFNDTSVSNGVGYVYNIYAYNDLGGRGNDWSQGGSYVYPSSDQSSHVWNYPANDYVVGDFAAYELTLGPNFGGGLAWRINRTIDRVSPLTAMVNRSDVCVAYGNMTVFGDNFVLKTYAFMGDYSFDGLQAELIGKESLSTKWGLLSVDHWTMSDGWGATLDVWVHDGIMVKTVASSSGTLNSETLLVDTNLTQITGD